MSGHGAYTKNISPHPIVVSHPYTWEHYSQHNNKNLSHMFGMITYRSIDYLLINFLNKVWILSHTLCLNIFNVFICVWVYERYKYEMIITSIGLYLGLIVILLSI